MRSLSTRVAVAILIAGVVALAAGCGGGGGNSSPSTDSSTVTLTRTGGGSGAKPAFASAGNCRAMANLAAKAAGAIQSSGNVAHTLHAEAAEIQALAKAAPSDIHGDFQTLADAFSSFIDTLQAGGYKLGSNTPPTPAQAAALAGAAKSLDTPKLRQAEQHLQAWAKQNCTGIHGGG